MKKEDWYSIRDATHKVRNAIILIAFSIFALIMLGSLVSTPIQRIVLATITFFGVIIFIKFFNPGTLSKIIRFVEGKLTFKKKYK